MRRIIILSLSVLCLMAPRSAAAPPETPVAIVYSLSGDAFRTDQARKQQPVKLLDCLPAGASLQVGPGSRLEIAFVDGKRRALGGGARVTLSKADLTIRSGEVHALPAVPRLPHLPAIHPEEHAGLCAGAVIVRSEGIAGLYPRCNATALADATVLRFQPLGGTEKYRVEIQDRKGAVVFSTETEEPLVKLPAGTLRPGTLYQWTVRTVDRSGFARQDKTSFTTLDVDSARRREALSRAAKDPKIMALLAGLDWQLGLLAEARAELEAALKATPGDPTLSAALAAVERDLAGKEEGPGKDETGFVVEEVTPRSLGAMAGLRPGDFLLSWCRSGAADGLQCLAKGKLTTAFDLADLETEQVPRGGVRVAGKRGMEDAVWDLLPGPLGIEARPVLPASLEKLDHEARDLAKGGELDAAAERWRTAAALAGADGRSLSIWFLWRAASLFRTGEKAAQADAFFAAALEKAQKDGDRLAAWVFLSWGQALQKRAVSTEAERYFRRALELYQRLGSAELAVAAVHHALCALAIERDANAAEASCRQALMSMETLAPHSFALSAILNSLGWIALEHGDLPAAERFFQRALALDTEIAPGSLASVLSLEGAAKAARRRSDLVTAEDLLRRERAILAEAEPDGLRLATALEGLGSVAAYRGDLETGEDLLRRSLEINERLDPGGRGIPTKLYNLGVLAAMREDLETAQRYMQRALDMSEKIAPEGFLVSMILTNLGAVMKNRGDVSAARDLFQRALAICEKDRPLSLETAAVLNQLGTLVPDDGDIALAEGYFQRAATIEEKLALGTGGEATLYNLGRAKKLERRFDSAAELFCRAVDTLEIKRGRLGGSDTTAFGATTASYYAACVGARIKSGKLAEAFRILERGRARAFLDQLAERSDLAASELPAELANRRKELDSAYDGTQSALSDLEPVRDKARIEELQARLREIRNLQDELAARVRRESPRYASLHDPQTLDLASARRTLDPGTVLLSYAVDEDTTSLLVVQPAEVRGPGIATFSLPIGEKALRAAIATFRNLLQNPGSDRRTLTSQAQKLYDLLLGPAEHQFVGAARLLVSADGPLHILPFAALLRRGHYLAAWKPLHFVLSASVYAEIKRSRRPSVDPADFNLVAFGAPLYPRLNKKREEVPAASLEVFTAVRRGLSLEPLPASRQEVEGIASLFPEAHTFLGSEATEERAKAIAPQARLLHFACHGLLDERFPLNSALALTIPEKPAPGQDNGLLQVWEIFESMRLDAELVTLSACDSGLGREMGSEGLIGLTRAFQFAGARSVLASLWSVADSSTADLMKRFYGYLRQGKTKDEALRAAQTELIHSAKLSHPYHWAAFQLSGDWQ